MPNLADHQSSSITKLLLEGDSKKGKTTSLAALVALDYKLRVWDFDNGLSPLIKEIKIRCPNKLGNVEYEPLRELYTGSGGMGSVLKVTPEAYTKANRLLDKWSDGSKPEEWGSDYIAVFDSLTHMSNAAFNWSKLMHGAMLFNPGISQKGVDPRNIYQTAQGAILNMLALITSDSFNTNVIVISHIKYRDMQDGTTKGFPNSIGVAIGPEILTYFNNNVISFESSNQGGIQKRLIRTQSNAFLDLATSSAVPETLDAYDGLAKFFSKKGLP